MAADRGWSRLLSLLDARTRPVAFLAIVLDLVVLAVVPTLPEGQRILGFLIFGLLLLASLIAMVILTKQIKAKDHTRPNLESKVTGLMEQLVASRFLPDLIIAIPRSGLIVAGMLAHALGEQKIVPVISLVRNDRQDFENRFNRLDFSRADFDANASSTVRILIVDDICASGRTLRAAKGYVERCLKQEDFECKTAAISFYGTHSHAEAPSFFVERLSVAILGASGDLEAMPD